MSPLLLTLFIILYIVIPIILTIGFYKSRMYSHTENLFIIFGADLAVTHMLMVAWANVYFNCFLGSIMDFAMYFALIHAGTKPIFRYIDSKYKDANNELWIKINQFEIITMSILFTSNILLILIGYLLKNEKITMVTNLVNFIIVTIITVYFLKVLIDEKFTLLSVIKSNILLAVWVFSITELIDFCNYYFNANIPFVFNVVTTLPFAWVFAVILRTKIKFEPPNS